MGSATRDRSEPAAAARRSRWWLAGRAARKVVMTTAGAAVVVLGVVLLPLPGPGMLVVGLGLGILSTEYRWPGRFSRWLRQEAHRRVDRLGDRRRARRRRR